jgi:rubrerythrin
MTAQNLRSAYASEAMAHLRYRIWADRAMDEGFPGVARLFCALAHAEQVHAGNHFAGIDRVNGAVTVAATVPFGVGDTVCNLRRAIAEETFLVEEVYPLFKNAALRQGEKGAARSFHYALSTEKGHVDLLRNALADLEAGGDAGLDIVRVCQACGFTCDGSLPDLCPLCGGTHFESFGESHALGTIHVYGEAPGSERSRPC